MLQHNRWFAAAARTGLAGLAVVAALAVAVSPALADGRGGMGSGEASVTGPITVLPTTAGWIGDWTVGTVTVHVSTSTEINQDDGAVAVGAVVSVEGTLQTDGSINATSIEVKLSAAGGPAEVTVKGTIQSLPTSGLIGDWMVSGVTVHVDASTKIDQEAGAAVVGARVVVEGALQADQSVNAASIEVLPTETAGPASPTSDTIEFVGAIKTLPGTADFTGDWVVATTTVHVTTSTTIDQSQGTVAVGALVKVEGALQSDGSVNAAEIKVLPASASSADSATHVFAVLKLTPTADAPAGAEGQVVTRHFVFPDGTIREDLKVMVEGLLPNTAYDVTIDTVAAGTIMTDDEGEGNLFLSTASIPGAEPLPTSLQPVTALKQVTITDPNAVVIFTGDFANAMINSGEEGHNAFTSIAPLKNVSGTVDGMASAAIRGQQQLLFVAAFDLTPGATVHIVVDGTDLGGFTVDGDGSLKQNFAAMPDSDQLPLPAALLPVSSLLHIEIQDTGGNALLTGDFTVVTSGGVSAMGQLRHHVGRHH